MKKINITAAVLALMLGSCGESLFDTYKDFAGDGEIRYIGMAKNLMVSPGWEHINVTWANATDPIISQMKVKWIADEVRDSVFLPAGTTSYDIQNLTTGPTTRFPSWELTRMAMNQKLSRNTPAHTMRTTRPCRVSRGSSPVPFSSTTIC